MNIRTFQARSMQQALLEVKQQLGGDAVVLQTRTVKPGGWRGLMGAKLYEVSAADGREVAALKAKQRRQRLAKARRGAAGGAAGGAPAERGGVAPAGDVIRRTYAAAASEAAERRGRVAAGSDLGAGVGAGARAVVQRMASPVSPDASALRGEVAEIKRLVARVAMDQKRQRLGVASNGADAAPAGLPDALFDQYRRLIEQEVSEDLAERAVAQARGTLGEAGVDDQAACLRAVRDAVATLLPVEAGEAEGGGEPRRRGPRVVALIGPTGVGKTTTIAKLAANYKLKQARSVGLITLDTYRIAAVEQLKVYANIIGLPVHVVRNTDELARAKRLLSGCDVVLLDTAGRSQRNGERLEELQAFLEAAQPDETHLVLSATSSQRVMLETAERFKALGPDRVLFTKLDEAVTFGGLLTVARAMGQRVSYLTTGQEVPHQIEPAGAERIASLVMRGALPGDEAGEADPIDAEPRGATPVEAPEPRAESEPLREPSGAPTGWSAVSSPAPVGEEAQP